MNTNEKKQRATQYHALKLQGFNDTECSKIMGVSCPTLNRLKKTIEYHQCIENYISKQSDIIERINQLHIKMINSIENVIIELDTKDKDVDQLIRLIAAYSKFLNYSQEL